MLFFFFFLFFIFFGVSDNPRISDKDYILYVLRDVLAHRIVGITHGGTSVYSLIHVVSDICESITVPFSITPRNLYKGKKSVSYMYVVMVLLFVFAF